MATVKRYKHTHTHTPKNNVDAVANQFPLKSTRTFNALYFHKSVFFMLCFCYSSLLLLLFLLILLLLFHWIQTAASVCVCKCVHVFIQLVKSRWFEHFNCLYLNPTKGLPEFFSVSFFYLLKIVPLFPIWLIKLFVVWNVIYWKGFFSRSFKK